MKRVLWGPGLALVAALSGCHALDSLTNPAGSNGMSSDQASAFAKQVAGAFSNGLNSAKAAPPAAAPAAVQGPSAVPVNVQVNARTNCTAGGNIQMLGSLTGNVTESGSGVVLLSVTLTISDWQCITGYIVNGDPYISGAGNMNFMNGAQSSAATFSLGGGFKWGTTAAESCQMNLTFLVNPDGTGHASGTVCGYAVDVST